MIAIAGTIGTGLFLGSGSALAQGGPVGCFLGYLIMGSFIGLMMYCLVSHRRGSDVSHLVIAATVVVAATVASSFWLTS